MHEREYIFELVEHKLETVLILTYMPATAAFDSIRKDTQQGVNNFISLLRIAILHYKANTVSQKFGYENGKGMLKTPSKTDSLLVRDPDIHKYDLSVDRCSA